MQKQTQNLLIGGGIVAVIAIIVLATQFSGTFFRGQATCAAPPLITTAPSALTLGPPIQNEALFEISNYDPVNCPGTNWDEQKYALLDSLDKVIKEWPSLNDPPGQNVDDLVESGFASFRIGTSSNSKAFFTFDPLTQINGQGLPADAYQFVIYNSSNNNVMGEITLNIDNCPTEPTLNVNPTELDFTLAQPNQQTLLEITPFEPTKCPGTDWTDQKLELLDSGNNKIAQWNNYSDAFATNFMGSPRGPGAIMSNLATITFDSTQPLNGNPLPEDTYTLRILNGVNEEMGTVTLNILESTQPPPPPPPHPTDVCKDLPKMEFFDNEGNMNSIENAVVPPPSAPGKETLNIQNMVPPQCLSEINFIYVFPDGTPKIPLVDDTFLESLKLDNFVTFDEINNTVEVLFTDNIVDELVTDYDTEVGFKGFHEIKFINSNDQDRELGSIYMSQCRGLDAWNITQNGQDISQSNPIILNENNISDTHTATVGNVFTDACVSHLNYELVDPQGTDHAKDLLFEFASSGDTSFFNAVPTSDPNTVDLTFNVGKHANTIFTEKGVYTLNVKNKYDDNTVLGQIFFEMEPAPADPPPADPPPADPPPADPPPADPPPADPPPPAPVDITITTTEPVDTDPIDISIVLPPTATTPTTPTTPTTDDLRPAAPDQDCGTYTDAGTFSSYVCDIAKRAQEEGIFTSAKFRPNDEVLRYESALTIVRSLGLSESCVPSVLNIYGDVDQQAEYFDELCTGVTAKIITGYEDDPANKVLLPARQVTFRELSRMLMNGYLTSGKATLPRTYTEVAGALGFEQASDNDWFGYSLQFMVNNGFISIAELQNMNLDRNLSRVEIADTLLKSL